MKNSSWLIQQIKRLDKKRKNIKKIMCPDCGEQLVIVSNQIVCLECGYAK